MKQSKQTALRRNFETVANDYLKAFCEKHEYDYEDARNNWALGDVGGITEVGYLFVSLNDIRTDIDMNAPADEFLKWHDYTLRVHTIQSAIPPPDGVCSRLQCKASDFTTPNYLSWLRGYSRKSDAELTEMEDDLKADLEWREKFREKWDAWRKDFEELAKQSDF